MKNLGERKRTGYNKKRVAVLTLVVALIFGVACFFIIKTNKNKNIKGEWELLARNYLDIYLGSEISNGEYLNIKDDGRVDYKIIKEVKDASWSFEDKILKIENDDKEIKLTYEDKVLTYEGEDYKFFFIKKASDSPKIREIKELIAENTESGDKTRKAKKKVVDTYTDENVSEVYGDWRMFAEEYIEEGKKPIVIEKQKNQKTHLTLEEDGKIVLVRDEDKMEGSWKINKELNIIDVEFRDKQALILTIDKIMILVTEDGNSYFSKPGEKSEKKSQIIKILKESMKE